MKLQAHIRLAWAHAVPFAEADHAAARQYAPIDAVVILHNRPPAERERRGRAPVHGAKPKPLRRDSERLDDVPLAFPAVEKRAEGDAPVTVEPCPDELLRTGGPQPLLVRLNVNVLVIVDLRRDEHPFEPGHRIADDAVAQGGGINVTLAHPLMPGPARVSRGPQTNWHACAGAQRRHQLHHWGGAREIPDLLYINPRVVVALVHVGIGMTLQIGEAQPGAVWRTPHLLRLVERPSQRPVDHPRPFDGFHKLRSGPPDHEPDGILAIAARMSAELAEHPICLAAASSAAKEDFEHLALQQPHLGAVATRRPDDAEAVCYCSFSGSTGIGSCCCASVSHSALLSHAATR